MIIEKANQPKPEYPQLIDPVNATFETDVYYADDENPNKARKTFYCDRVFAVCVLKEIEKWCLRYGFHPVHLGCYVPRYARKFNGEEIKPRRWSNHSYGLAIDFKGIISEGKYIPFSELTKNAPKKLLELVTAIKTQIKAHNRGAEIVNEGPNSWMHIGIWK